MQWRLSSIMTHYPRWNKWLSSSPLLTDHYKAYRMLMSSQSGYYWAYIMWSDLGITGTTSDFHSSHMQLSWNIPVLHLFTHFKAMLVIGEAGSWDKAGYSLCVTYVVKAGGRRQQRGKRRAVFVWSYSSFNAGAGGWTGLVSAYVQFSAIVEVVQSRCCK